MTEERLPDWLVEGLRAKHPPTTQDEVDILRRLRALGPAVVEKARADAGRGAAIAHRLRQQAESRRGKHGVSPDLLRERVLDIHTRRGGASWSSVCETVGRKVGISGRQVRRLVPETKW